MNKQRITLNNYTGKSEMSRTEHRGKYSLASGRRCSQSTPKVSILTYILKLTLWASKDTIIVTIR